VKPVIALVLLASAVQFGFNPMGLGPEPERFLTSDFFETRLERSDDIELLVDGVAAFDTIFEAIEGATTRIDVQTYIWRDDATGNHVASSLREAAARGVEVRVRKDVLGSVFELGDVLAGRPSPVFTRSGLRGQDNIEVSTDPFDDNDHSKYFVIDESTVIFGGMNIADEYHHQWHDYMVWIRHERFAEAFDARVLEGKAWPITSPAVLAVNDRQATEIRTAMIEILDRARATIVIEHAYFSEGRVLEAVLRAARRGVAVDVVLPEEPDTHLYANRATINRLLALGEGSALRVHLYPRMTHAKVILVDGVVAAVGSANLTPRSLITSKEITLFLHGAEDVPFIRDLAARLASDIAESRRVETPFRLGLVARLGAVAGKYTW